MAQVQVNSAALIEPLISRPGGAAAIQAAGASEKKQVHSRLLALDLFRGLIIMIMAW